jgi:Domain of unknown function (DUF6457)
MELKEWLTTLSAELQTTDVPLDEDAVHILLDLARDSAHEVERVAAPLTTFLVGIAVGRGATLGGAAAKATALLMNEDAARATEARTVGDNSDAAHRTDAHSASGNSGDASD